MRAASLRTISIASVFVIGLSFFGLEPQEVKGPGGYGAMPSKSGFRALKELKGKTLDDVNDDFGGGKWTIGKLVVILNPLTTRAKGPLVSIKKNDTTHWLPMESDGDVADLHRRATGQAHPTLKGKPGRAYSAAWQGRRWIHSRVVSREEICYAEEPFLVPTEAAAHAIANAVWKPAFGQVPMRNESRQIRRDGRQWILTAYTIGETSYPRRTVVIDARNAAVIETVFAAKPPK